MLKFDRYCVTRRIFFKAYNKKLVPSLHTLIVFTIFSFLVNEKIKLKVLAGFFEITY
jgi:hypothetical protein